MLQLQVVVEDAVALRIVGHDQAKRHVQHRHEKPHFCAHRGLERVRMTDDGRL